MVLTFGLGIWEYFDRAIASMGVIESEKYGRPNFSQPAEYITRVWSNWSIAINLTVMSSLL